MGDVKISACKFSADIVPYMYGEMPVPERSVFESHLPNCGECTDEFASVSSARYEVYDWKKLAFDPLATPRFAIPYQETATAGAGWFERLRAALVSGWEVPGLAFAGLAIVAVLATSLILFSDPATDIAGVDNENTSTVKPSVVELPKPVTAAVEETNVNDPGSEMSSPVPIKAVPSTSGRLDHRRVNRTSRPQSNRFPEVRPASAQNVPRLNEFAEDEDTSLRLAELFEDIETSD